MATSTGTLTSQARVDDTAQDRRRARATAVGSATAAAAVVWLLAEFAFGVDIQAPAFDGSATTWPVGPIRVIVTAAVASLAGWALLATLERFTTRARVIWPAIAVGVLLLRWVGRWAPPSTRAAVPR